MSRPEFSLAYLTAFGTAPARMVDIAAETGYDYVSLRLTPVTDHEPTFPYFTDPSVVADVKARMADTEVSVLDVELIRVGPDDDPAEYGSFMEIASDLGARHLIMQLPDPDRSRAAERFAQTCQMAAPYRMTVDLEFIPWSTTEDLAAAVEIVTKADQPNGGVLIDTLHFARSKSSVADLQLLPENLFNFVQLCDAPFEAPRTHEGLINAARTARSLPGQAGLDLRPLMDAIPRVPYSLEVPNDIMRNDLGVEEFARRVLRGPDVPGPGRGRISRFRTAPMTSVLVMNGPNLNLLGTREPGIYGSETLPEIVSRLRDHATSRDVELRDFQSNSEGDLVTMLHTSRGEVDGVILNAGALTHYSVALRDAISGTGLPVVETHISNVHAREEFRKTSVIAPVCVGIVAGFGADSYIVAFDGLIKYLGKHGSDEA